MNDKCGCAIKATWSSSRREHYVDCGTAPDNLAWPAHLSSRLPSSDMPIVYNSAESSQQRRNAAARTTHDFIDADDSIVLSDLVRTGEHSRLRRRGAMRLDHGLHTHAMVRTAAPADDIDEGTTGGTSSEPMHLQRYPLRRYSSVGPADEYRYQLYCNGCQRQDGADEEPEWLERSPSPYEPSPLPLYPTPPRSASQRSPPTNAAPSCGALIHGQAAPRQRLGVWTAKSEASDVVVPMDPEYFESSAIAKVIHSPCGCVRECVGCALW